MCLDEKEGCFLLKKYRITVCEKETAKAKFEFKMKIEGHF